MQAPDALTIRFNATQSSFSPMHGGMMTSLIMAAPEGLRELLYFVPDYKFDNTQGMNGGAPFCFPISGRLMNSEYFYQGQRYAMNIHGFAYQMPWQVLVHEENLLKLNLLSNAATLQQYPFKFEVILEYEVQDNLLICRQSYHNHDSVPMPYYSGFHPYLRLPFPKAEISLNYMPIERLQYNETLTDIIGKAELFEIPTNLTLPVLNESLVKLRDNKLIYLNFPDGSTLTIEAQGIEDPDLFKYVQVYHRAAEPFICIEPWMNYPNAINHKNAVRTLAPGGCERGIFYLRLKA